MRLKTQSQSKHVFFQTKIELSRDIDSESGTKNSSAFGSIPEDIFKEISIHCDRNSILRLRRVSSNVRALTEREYPLQDEDVYQPISFQEIEARARCCELIEKELSRLCASQTLIKRLCYFLTPCLSDNNQEMRRKDAFARRFKIGFVVGGMLCFGVIFTAIVTNPVLQLGSLFFIKVTLDFFSKLGGMVARKLYGVSAKRARDYYNARNKIASLKLELKEKKEPFVRPLIEKQIKLKVMIEQGRRMVERVAGEGPDRPSIGFRV